MKYSLIIPTYNAEKTIALCLESALTQRLSGKEYEIIVVGDGSTDNTMAIAKDYPVTVIERHKQGPAAARNMGADAANGDILIFTDSDCELGFNFLEKIVSPFTRNSDVVGVQGSYRTKQKAFISQFAQAEIETRYNRMNKNKYIDFIGTYAAAYRKDIFQKYKGFDTAFTMASGEDTEFSYTLHNKGYRMVFAPEAFVYHRHPAKLADYLRSKFYRGYWRVRLYAKHPKKIIKDSYTTQSLKFQVASIPFLFIFTALSVFNAFWISFAFLIAISFLFFSIPFFKLLKERKNAGAFLVIPVVLFLRALSLLLGMLFGMIGGLANKREVNSRTKV